MRFRIVSIALAACLFLFALILPALLLGGCAKARAPSGDALAAAAHQSAVEADAGARAAKVRLGAALTPDVGDILDGSAAFARATLGESAAPAATWTVERIVAAPRAYRLAGESAERKANGTQWWFWLKVGAVPLIGVALALVKNLPGVGGLVGGVAEGLWRVYAPKATKQEEEARSTLVDHATGMLQVAASAAPPDVRLVLLSAIPEPVRDAAIRLGITVPPAREQPPLPAIVA